LFLSTCRTCSWHVHPASNTPTRGPLLAVVPRSRVCDRPNRVVEDAIRQNIAFSHNTPSLSPSPVPFPFLSLHCLYLPPSICRCCAM
jgi:hypothetical protein